MADPAITVIIPAYGVAALLGEAIDSLIAQDFAAWEAIIVDDGDTEAVAAAFARYTDPRIRLLQTDNGGVALARQRAIARARAPLIALLDGDDRYAPHYLATMVAAIEADPTLGFVSCDAIYFGGTARDGERISDHYLREPPVTLDRVLSRRFNVYTGAVVRRAGFEAVGGYNPLLQLAEDFDLWIRLLSAGWRADYVAEPLAHYRRRAGSLSSNTLPLLRATATVYRTAAAALAGRPEAETAAAMLHSAERDILWTEGETLISEGQPREGTRLLWRARGGRGSLAWTIALPVMRAAPSLARPILDWRARLNDGT
jgi:glycosyltransferase involved in cell wall biosynthesis